MLGCLTLSALGFNNVSARPNTTLPSFVFDYGKELQSIHRAYISLKYQLKCGIFSTTCLAGRSRNVFSIGHVRSSSQY